MIKYHNCNFSLNVTELIPFDQKEKIEKKISEINLFELKVREFKKNNLIVGFCHTVIGREFIYGILYAILDKDIICTSYRCHGAAMITGSATEDILSSLLGKKNKMYNSERGGSMQLYNHRLFGGHGIVGAQVSLGIGLAFSQRYLQSKEITIVIFGDGAANNGQVYESFIIAKYLNLPVLFICENNHMALKTKTDIFQKKYEIYTRVPFPSISISTASLTEYFNVLNFSYIYVKNNNGPILVEIELQKDNLKNK